MVRRGMVMGIVKDSKTRHGILRDGDLLVFKVDVDFASPNISTTAWNHDKNYCVTEVIGDGGVDGDICFFKWDSDLVNSFGYRILRRSDELLMWDGVAGSDVCCLSMCFERHHEYTVKIQKVNKINRSW